MSQKLKLAEFCAGTGAFSYAFHKTDKVNTVYANDFEKNSKKIFDQNFSIKLDCKDIHDLKIEEIPSMDIITSGFPCFVAGTKVLTNNGYKNIEEVDLSDKLLTHTGKFQNILNLQKKEYNGELYKLDIKYHPTDIICTEEHPFYVRSNNQGLYSEPYWKKASELTMNDYIGMVITSDNIDNNIYLKNTSVNDINDINEINNLSYNMALELQRLLLKLGYIFSIIKNNNDYQIIKIKDCLSFIENNYVWYEISNIDKYNTINTPVYNFEVENDNSYCVENTIVHNCQPFSIAGQQEGFQDERSNVFWQLIKIIEHHKPRFIIFENVKNLKSHDNGRTFKTITDEITRINYHYKYEILNTCKYTNIPQNRERIYIVCFKEKADFDKFNFDLKKPTEIKTLASLMQNEVDDKYYYTDRLKIWDEISTSITNNISTGSIYQYRRYYVRENKNKICPTLTANMGSGGHNVPLIKDNKGIRKLTPRECFNLQGFPVSYKIDNISDAGLYKLAGNAVSIPIVMLVAKKLMDIVDIDENNNIDD